MVAGPPHDDFDDDPFDEIRRMQDDMDSIFDRFFAGTNNHSTSRQPKHYDSSDASTDLVSLKDVVFVIVELPDFKKDEIKVKASKFQVEIKAKSERNSFYRLVDLPDEIREDRTTATFKNGVLELKLAKKEKVSPK